MRVSRWSIASAVVVVVVVASAGAAWAHVSIDPPSAPKGAGDQVITFRVPNEQDTAGTVKLGAQFPPDDPIAAIDALATPDWTAVVETTHLTTPITTDDGSFSDVVSVITWTGELIH